MEILLSKVVSVTIAVPLTRFNHTMGRMTIKSTRSVLGHSLVRSLIPSHPTLIRSLRTVCFACALRCAHSFVRSLNHILPSSKERDLRLSIELVDFKQSQPNVCRRHHEARYHAPILSHQICMDCHTDALLQCG